MTVTKRAVYNHGNNFKKRQVIRHAPKTDRDDAFRQTVPVTNSGNWKYLIPTAERHMQ